MVYVIVNKTGREEKGESSVKGRIKKDEEVC